MTGRVEQFLAMLRELAIKLTAIKLTANQLVIFGGSGRRTFVEYMQYVLSGTR